METTAIMLVLVVSQFKVTKSNRQQFSYACFICIGMEERRTASPARRCLAQRPGSGQHRPASARGPCWHSSSHQKIIVEREPLVFVFHCAFAGVVKRQEQQRRASMLDDEQAAAGAFIKGGSAQSGDQPGAARVAAQPAGSAAAAHRGDSNTQRANPSQVLVTNSELVWVAKEPTDPLIRYIYDYMISSRMMCKHFIDHSRH